jgi:glutamyl-tRNA reductase
MRRRKSGTRPRSVEISSETDRGITIARTIVMSGPTISKALHARFEAIRRVELERLRKKLGGLSEEDRRRVESITADVIHAIARVPADVLVGDLHPPAVDAVVRLFALEHQTG